MAEPTDAERLRAQSYVDLAVELFRGKKHGEAIEEFQRAQELVPIPLNLYNVARCYEELGEVEEAIRSYESYVAFSLDDAGEEQRLERARAAIRRLKVRARPAPRREARPKEESRPSPVAATVEPETRGVRVRADGGPISRVPPSRQSSPADSRPLPTVAEARVDEGAEPASAALPFTVGGALLATAVAAFVLSGLAADTAQEAYAAHGRSAATGDDEARRRQYEETQSGVLAHQVLLGLTVGLAAAGVGAGVWGGLRLLDGPEASAVCWPGPWGVRLRWRF